MSLPPRQNIPGRSNSQMPSQPPSRRPSELYPRTTPSDGSWYSSYTAEDLQKEGYPQARPVQTSTTYGESPCSNYYDGIGYNTGSTQWYDRHQPSAPNSGPWKSGHPSTMRVNLNYDATNGYGESTRSIASPISSPSHKSPSPEVPRDYQQLYQRTSHAQNYGYGQGHSQYTLERTTQRSNAVLPNGGYGNAGATLLSPSTGDAHQSQKGRHTRGVPQIVVEQAPDSNGSQQLPQTYASYAVNLEYPPFGVHGHARPSEMRRGDVGTGSPSLTSRTAASSMRSSRRTLGAELGSDEEADEERLRVPRREKRRTGGKNNHPRTRRLTLDGREHAKDVRRVGACDKCRQRHLKCTHVLPEDVESNSRSPTPQPLTRRRSARASSSGSRPSPYYPGSPKPPRIDSWISEPSTSRSQSPAFCTSPYPASPSDYGFDSYLSDQWTTFGRSPYLASPDPGSASDSFSSGHSTPYPY